jgi:hypothetical protein
MFTSICDVEYLTLNQTINSTIKNARHDTTLYNEMTRESHGHSRQWNLFSDANTKRHGNSTTKHTKMRDVTLGRGALKFKKIISELLKNNAKYGRTIISPFAPSTCFLLLLGWEGKGRISRFGLGGLDITVALKGDF